MSEPVRRKACIFDIGGVLLRFDLHDVARRLAGEAADAREALLALGRDAALVEVETGRVSGPEFFERWVRPLVPRRTYADLVAAWTETFVLNAPGLDLLREMGGRGHPLYVLSNLSEFTLEAIEAKFPRLFDGVREAFFSFRLGMVKPDPRIYQAVCRRAGVAPAECVFLDDTPACVEGARRVGMTGIVFSNERIGEIRRELGCAEGAADGGG